MLYKTLWGRLLPNLLWFCALNSCMKWGFSWMCKGTLFLLCGHYSIKSISPHIYLEPFLHIFYWPPRLHSHWPLAPYFLLSHRLHFHLPLIFEKHSPCCLCSQIHKNSASVLYLWTSFLLQHWGASKTLPPIVVLKLSLVSFMSCVASSCFVGRNVGIDHVDIAAHLLYIQNGCWLCCFFVFLIHLTSFVSFPDHVNTMILILKMWRVLFIVIVLIYG